jgi:hypothetical protein
MRSRARSPNPQHQNHTLVTAILRLQLGHFGRCLMADGRNEIFLDEWVVLPVSPARLLPRLPTHSISVDFSSDVK